MKNYTTEEVNGLLDEALKDYVTSELYSIEFLKQFKKDKGLMLSYKHGTWYNTKNGNDVMLACYQGKGNYQYGFYVSGGWCDALGSAWIDSPTCQTIEATEEEVLTALTKEAEKRGFKEGVTINNSNLPCDLGRGSVLRGALRVNYCGIWIDSTRGYGRLIYKDGKWATIVNTELTDLENKYKELGEEIKRLKK